MFLDYWMVITIMVVFAYALYDVYHKGYQTGYVSGGIYAHTYTMRLVENVVSRSDLEKIRNSMINNDVN